MPMLEIKIFKIYGFVAGINYYSSSLEEDFGEKETPYKMVQLMFLVFGISIIIWDAE
jgi:hypothetical protein